jgi:hypothetical protein
VAKSKVLSGARSILWIGTTPAGIFNSTQFGINYDVAPAFILGRFSAAELVYTGCEVVQLSMSGFRVTDHGPFAVIDKDTGARMVPRLQDLLNYDDISVSLHDRLEEDPNKPIMIVTMVKPVGFNSSMGARALGDFSVTMQGLHFSDEDGDNDESAGAADLP